MDRWRGLTRRISRRTLLARGAGLAAGITFGGVLSGAQARPNPARVFNHVNVIAMDRPGVLWDQAVLVADGLVRAVAPAMARIPEGIVSIPADGRFLMPGLADMHLHLASPADLLVLLANGVTTVRDMSGTRDKLAWERAVAAGSMPGTHHPRREPHRGRRSSRLRRLAHRQHPGHRPLAGRPLRGGRLRVRQGLQRAALRGAGGDGRARPPPRAARGGPLLGEDRPGAGTAGRAGRAGAPLRLRAAAGGPAGAVERLGLRLRRRADSRGAHAGPGGDDPGRGRLELPHVSGPRPMGARSRRELLSCSAASCVT